MANQLDQVRPAWCIFSLEPVFDGSLAGARCQKTSAGSLRWKIRLDTGLTPDITVALRMDPTNEAPLDYDLLPLLDMSTNRIRLAEKNGLMLDAFRFETLAFFFAMAERAKISEIAA